MDSFCWLAEVDHVITYHKGTVVWLPQNHTLMLCLSVLAGGSSVEVSAPPSGSCASTAAERGGPPHAGLPLSLRRPSAGQTGGRAAAGGEGNSWFQTANPGHCLTRPSLSVFQEILHIRPLWVGLLPYFTLYWFLKLCHKIISNVTKCNNRLACIAVYTRRVPFTVIWNVTCDMFSVFTQSSNEEIYAPVCVI